jgi:hypothetical protein
MDNPAIGASAADFVAGNWTILYFVRLREGAVSDELIAMSAALSKSAHSYLKATIGSTLAARRAGIHVALIAIPASIIASRAYVQGSVALKP